MLHINQLQVRDTLYIKQLTIASGELIAICGPNGAGKSTLIETLAGFLKPTSGSIAFNGRLLSDYRVRELAQYRSWLSQQPQHRAHLSVRQQLELTVAHAPLVSREKVEQVIEYMVTQFDLVALLERSLPSLSGGELQRVSLATIFLSSDIRLYPQQRLLLLDEPLSSLDPRYQHQVIRLLQDRQQQGQTIMLSLHDLNLALFYSMNVLLLGQGRLKINGPAQQVLTSQALVELFGVSMAQISLNGRNQLILT